MGTEQFNVPEAVLDAFMDGLVEYSIEEAFEAALKKYNEELLGDEAIEAAKNAGDALYDSTPLDEPSPTDTVIARVGIEAAIDSVVKGGESG